VDILDPDGFSALVRQRGCKVIQLQRRNAVKAVVSTLNARRQWEASGNWNLLSESTRLPAFAVDVDEFDRLLEERERLDSDLERYVEQLQRPTLRLFYEDLLQDDEGFVRQTLTFLGCKTSPQPGATLKNTKDDLREAIVNFDELRARYAGTRYESMFDEVLAPA
jgi:LPS sulfotransferase NodH